MRTIILATLIVAAAACSPGTLPGTPSPIASGGGGARYNGFVTYRRTGGNFAINEAAQTLVLALVVRDANQITGRFESGESSGTIQGNLTGDLAAGTFEATILIQTPATQAAGGSVCEGRGQIFGSMQGRNLTFTAAGITYDNCAGLSVTSQAQATAVSPIPGSFGSRSNLVITVLGGTNITRGTCDATPGYPFTVEMAETAGVDVTFDSSFLVEERRGFGATTATVLDMPFSELRGGTRMTYSACSPSAGTYQAFFSGSDANGNRVRVGSPLVTFVP